jgi:hypothetical protein
MIMPTRFPPMPAVKPPRRGPAMKVAGHSSVGSGVTSFPPAIRHSEWEPWFAWHPVITISGKHRWLSNVYRRTMTDFWLLNKEVTQYGDLFDILKDV